MRRDRRKEGDVDGEEVGSDRWDDEGKGETRGRRKWNGRSDGMDMEVGSVSAGRREETINEMSIEVSWRGVGREVEGMMRCEDIERVRKKEVVERRMKGRGNKRWDPRAHGRNNGSGDGRGARVTRW